MSMLKSFFETGSDPSLFDGLKIAKEKELYEQLVHVDRSGQDQFSMSDATLIGSLQILSGLLEKHFRRAE